MQQSFKNLLLVLCGALVLFGLHKGWNHPKHPPKQPLLTASSEKSFVIIIPSYNNASFVEKNLRSVFTQSYKNYRVIYIDDHSADDTYLKAKKLIGDLDQNHRTTLIRNEQNQGALANLYSAIHSCHDHEIVVLVDGDDFLAHEHVLSTLNQNYQDSSVWMTYGNFLDYPTYRQHPVCCKELSDQVIRSNSFRKHEWVTTHLRTFYASLFKKIHLEDMVYRGRFFPMGWDLAFMMPLLEMSGPHVRFIRETLYLYNRNNPISDHRVNFQFQQECAHAVRAKKPYKRLQELSTLSIKRAPKTEIVIFSSGEPLPLYALLESIQQHVEEANKISIICPKGRHIEAALEEVEKDFPKASFIYTSDLQAVMQQIVQDSSLDSSSHLLLAQDRLVIKDSIHLNDAALALNKTSAYALYFSLGTHIQGSQDGKSYQELPPLLNLCPLGSKTPLFAWQFNLGTGEWKAAHPFDFVLYSKEELQKALGKAPYKDLKSLQIALETYRTAEKLGVFYPDSKCVK